MTLSAYAHQDLPLERLIEALQPERSSSHIPFTKVMFAVQNHVLESIKLPGLDLELLEAEKRHGEIRIDICRAGDAPGVGASRGIQPGFV